MLTALTSAVPYNVLLNPRRSAQRGGDLTAIRLLGVELKQLLARLFSARKNGFKYLRQLDSVFTGVMRMRQLLNI